VDFKTATDLRTSLITSYNRLIDIDLTDGTPEKDTFVEAPIEGQLLDIWTALEYLYKLQAPFIYADQLLTEDLDVICRNYDVGIIPATYSTGELTFYTHNIPAADIIIDSSKGGKNADGTKTYTVSGYYVIPVSDISSYYNATNSRYEITVNIIADMAGPDGSIGAQTITQLTSSINGIEGCINNDAITGGDAEGSLTYRLNQVRTKFKGRSLSTTAGLLLYVQSYSPTATVVGSNDALMLRSEGLGGAIDIYIKDQILEGVTDTITITSTGLEGYIEDCAYTSTGIILTYQPVDSITMVIKNGTTVDSDYYTLTKDTGTLAKSTRSSDKVELNSDGIAALGYFQANDEIEIRYNYNKLLTTVESDLNSDVNAYDNRDYLVREQSEIGIDVYALVKVNTGVNINTVISAASLDIGSYLDSFDSSESSRIELIEILDIIKNTSGVDNINALTATLTASDGRTATASGDIPMYSNEYPKVGTVTLVEWTY